MTIVEFVEGPMWYFAATVFVLGVIFNLAALLLKKRPKDYSIPKPGASPVTEAAGMVVRHSWPHKDIAPKMRLNLWAGYAFHLGLFVLVFFAEPHIIFIEENITGFGWTAAPHWLFVVAAQVSFAGLLILMVKRMVDPVLRLISSKGDYIGSWLTFLTMATGCMAIMESFDAIRALHMLFVNLLLIYFPFSRLMHAFTFIFSRAETGLIYGRRGASL